MPTHDFVEDLAKMGKITKEINELIMAAHGDKALLIYAIYSIIKCVMGEGEAPDC